jgi:hypothetical protein
MVLNCMLSQFDRIIGTTYPFGAYGLGIVFCGFRVAHSQSIVFCVLVSTALFVMDVYPVYNILYSSIKEQNIISCFSFKI